MQLVLVNRTLPRDVANLVTAIEVDNSASKSFLEQHASSFMEDLATTDDKPRRETCRSLRNEFGNHFDRGVKLLMSVYVVGPNRHYSYSSDCLCNLHR